MSDSDASAKLTSAGFSANQSGAAYNDSVPEGNVISTEPSAGSELRPGSTVGLVVSEGPEPQDEYGDDGGNDDDEAHNNGGGDNGGGNGNNGDNDNDDD